jgi:integrase/recombinase XerD
MAILRLHKNGNWYLDYRDVDGERHPVSTRTKDKKKANLWLHKVEDLLDQANRGLIEKVGRINIDIVANRKKRNNSPTINEFKERWQNEQRITPRKLADKTIELTSTSLDSFCRFTGNKRITEITNDDVKEWQNSLREENKAQATIASYHRQLRAVFNASKGHYLNDVNPFSEVKPVAVIESKKQIKILSKIQIKALYQVIEEEGYQWYADFLRFLFNTGCRRNEILFLKWEAIDIDQKIITIFSEKTKKEIQIPINKSLQAVINRMGGKETGYVFQTQNSRNGANKKQQPWNKCYVSHLFKKFCKKAGLSDDFHLHYTRHTYATYLLQQGIPIEVAQKLLGHASPITTSKSYDHSQALYFREQADLVDFEDTGQERQKEKEE